MVAVNGERGGSKIFFERAVRLIVHPHAPLFLHHFALGLEIRFVHIEAAHAIGFEPEDTLEIIAGKGLEEIRVVVVGAGIVESAESFDDPGMLFRSHVRRAFEHQVLEEMRESSAAGALVFRPHVIPHLKVDHRNGVVFEQNHLQPIRQSVRGEMELWRANRFRFFLRRERRGKRGHAQHDDSETLPIPHVSITPIQGIHSA